MKDDYIVMTLSVDVFVVPQTVLPVSVSCFNYSLTLFFYSTVTMSINSVNKVSDEVSFRGTKECKLGCK